MEWAMTLQFAGIILCIRPFSMVQQSIRKQPLLLSKFPWIHIGRSENQTIRQLSNYEVVCSSLCWTKFRLFQFEKWSDNQRKQVMEDLILRCKVKQLEHAAEILKTKVPVHRDDFTRELPRVITLYIFSFLDPRSLCRCARVNFFLSAIICTKLLQMLKKCILSP
jgi:F-box protein 16